MTFRTRLQPHERLCHTIAFRLTDAEYIELMPFFEAFDGQASPALRWLLSQPASQALMARAVLEANG